MTIDEVLSKADSFIETVNNVEAQRQSDIMTRERLLGQIEELKEKAKEYSEAHDIAFHAIEILKGQSDEVVQKAYKYVENGINDTLVKAFPNSIRRIEITESVRGNYPQLELDLYVENGVLRSYKASGHGITQIISLICILDLIVLTGSRRFMLLDEVLSGVSAENRIIIDDIIQNFAKEGFQFLIIEHGFIPKGASVFKLEMTSGVTKVSENYIEEDGVYINHTRDVIDQMNQVDEITDDDIIPEQYTLK